MKKLLVAYLDVNKKVVGYLSKNRLMTTKPLFAFEVPEDGNAQSATLSAQQLMCGPHPFDKFGPLTVDVIEVEETWITRPTEETK